MSVGFTDSLVLNHSWNEAELWLCYHFALRIEFGAPLLLTATARLLGGDMQKHAESLSFGRLFIMKNDD